MNRFLILLLGLAACSSPSIESQNEFTLAEDDSIAETSLQLPKVERPTRTLYAGLLISDGVYNTELTAPMDIFHHSRFRSDTAIEVFTIAKTGDIITSFEGLQIVPDYSFQDSFPPIDILVVPSAEHHLDSDLEDTVLLNFVREVGTKARFVTSHCDGAFILAESGLLDGRECTTYPGDIDAFRDRYPTIPCHKEVLFVHDGKFITSAGGAKSFEAALYLHELLFGKEDTNLTAEGLVIDWNVNDVPCLLIPENQ